MIQKPFCKRVIDKAMDTRKYLRFIFILLGTVYTLAGQAGKHPYFQSLESDRVQLEFQGAVTVESSKDSVDTTNESIVEKIKDQLEYVRGNANTSGFVYETNKRTNEMIPFNIDKDVQIQIFGKSESTTSGLQIVKYKVITNGYIQKGIEKTEFILPMLNDSIPSGCYDAVMRIPYYFNPLLEGCSLKEGTDFIFAHAFVKKVLHQNSMQPNYDKIMPTNGEVEVNLFFGSLDDRNFLIDGSSSDSNAKLLVKLIEDLQQNGYQVRKKMNTNYETHVVLEKMFEDKKKLTINILYADSMQFQTQLTGPWKDKQIVGYFGHSRMGEMFSSESSVLSTSSSAKESPYRIILMNSCMSNVYYAVRVANLLKAPMHFIGHGIGIVQASNNDVARSFIGLFEQWLRFGDQLDFDSLLNTNQHGSLLGVFEF